MQWLALLSMPEFEFEFEFGFGFEFQFEFEFAPGVPGSGIRLPFSSACLSDFLLSFVFLLNSL